METKQKRYIFFSFMLGIISFFYSVIYFCFGRENLDTLYNVDVSGKKPPIFRKLNDKCSHTQRDRSEKDSNQRWLLIRDIVVWYFRLSHAVTEMAHVIYNVYATFIGFKWYALLEEECISVHAWERWWVLNI
jgi:hypothetical protein